MSVKRRKRNVLYRVNLGQAKVGKLTLYIVKANYSERENIATPTFHTLEKLHILL